MLWWWQRGPDKVVTQQTQRSSAKNCSSLNGQLKICPKSESIPIEHMKKNNKMPTFKGNDKKNINLQYIGIIHIIG